MPSILVWERLMAEERLKGKVAIPAEGSVLPDTYAYTTGETRAAVLKRMQAAMDKAFDELWAKRSPRTAAKDRNQALTLASDRRSAVQGKSESVRIALGGRRIMKTKQTDRIRKRK